MMPTVVLLWAKRKSPTEAVINTVPTGLEMNMCSRNGFCERAKKKPGSSLFVTWIVNHRAGVSIKRWGFHPTSDDQSV